ncbi:MAG TPA: hypothetical protein ENI71_04890 [Chromatiales bacterium]|nr:hypothetical protein [Chromatiales bacterium]
MPPSSNRSAICGRPTSWAVPSPAAQPARRSGADRRRCGLPPLRYWFYGQRRRARRREDQGYVDVYDPLVVGVCLATLMLACLDAYFTLLLISGGARELNPLMGVLLSHDPGLFINLKIALTAIGLLILILHKNFRLVGRVRVLHLEYALFGFYALLVAYELMLLA